MYYDHALDRARDRFGVDLADEDYFAICRQIQQGEHECARVRDAGDGREEWVVRHKGQWLVALYDTNTLSVVTFLPMRKPAMCKIIECCL